MKLEKWNDGYQIIVDVQDLSKMVQCSGMATAIEKMNKQANEEGMKVRRILVPSMMGSGIFGVPVVEATYGVTT